MKRILSVGTRWALRNTALLVLAAAAVAVYGHLEIQARVIRDAQLLLELEVKELVEELRHGALNVTEIERSVAPDFAAAAAADPDLQVSVQVFDSDGKLVYGRGLLIDENARLPTDVQNREVDALFSELERDSGDPYWVVSAAASEGFVQVGISSTEFIASAGQMRRVFLAAAPAFVLITAILGWLLSRASLRPIDQITGAARRISFAHLDQRIPTRGNRDELDRLAETLNEMIARLEEGAGSLRRFTADAAHQLRSPLSRLRSRLENALGESASDAPDSLRHAIAASLAEVDGISESITASLQLAESEAGVSPGQLERLSLRRLLGELTEFYGPLASEKGVDLRLATSEDVWIDGIATWLRQMFSNLLNNALRHAHERILVRLEIAGPDSVVVRVEDDGRGIPPPEKDRLFDRFYRGTVPPGEPGAGLGLAIALQIARAHGGCIDVESLPGKGSVFSVALPRCRSH